MSGIEPRGAAPFEGPRLEIDELLSQLVERAQDVMAAQNRLRGLLQATQSIVGELDLPTLLRRVVETARELIGADYAALGVVAADGSGLEQFVHVGMDTATIERIGPLPQGKGLLGALIDQPAPIRLRDLGEDVRSVGFPEHHPPMRTFLGVPVRVREEVFGNLYLTDAVRGEFTVDDEQFAIALAATAGIAIENARLYAQGRQRQQWLAASTEATRALLAGTDNGELQLIAGSVARLADAEFVTLVVPEPGKERFRVAAAVGLEEAPSDQFVYPMANTLSEQVLRTARPALVDDVTVHEGLTVHLAELIKVGPVMVLPLVSASLAMGTLVVGRLHGRRPFTQAEVDMASTFSGQAALALELAAARRDQERADLLEDRARIARDLHDHVIQQLFAAGMTLQVVAPSVPDPSRAELIEQVVDSLDDAIKQIRASIFQLSPPAFSGGRLRSALSQVVAEVSRALPFRPAVTFQGPVDAVADEQLAADVVAVVREALTNVAKYAQATTAAVRIEATRSGITITVTDDGNGLHPGVRTSGLANLRSRAERRGGQLCLNEPTPERGTTLVWSVPSH